MTILQQTPVIPPICDFAENHPDWCNKKHLAGADPVRQAHLHTWRSRRQVLPLTVELYPCRNPADVFFAARVASSGPNRYAGEVRTVLRADDARTLGQRLIDLADAADEMTAAWDEANGVQS